MTKKRIALITYHDVPNFGAVLQCWSLCATLRKMGSEVIVVDYKPDWLKEKFRRKSWRQWVPSLGAIRRNRFVSRYIPVGPRCSTRAEVSTFLESYRPDTVLCGSDQIWSGDSLPNLDTSYFLNFDLSYPVRKASYAPSCGTLRAFGDRADDVRHCFKSFEAISVRDVPSQRAIQPLCQQKVEIVLDPTLIADLSPLRKKGTNPTKPYIALVGPPSNHRDVVATKVSESLDLPVHAIGCRSSIATSQKPFVDPGEWASAIAESAFVVTSLFHGVMLAIQFRRPFLAAPAVGRDIKIRDALERFGMSDRIIDGKVAHDLDSVPISMCYEAVEDTLAAEISRSFHFLQRLIHD